MGRRPKPLDRLKPEECNVPVLVDQNGRLETFLTFSVIAKSCGLTPFTAVYDLDLIDRLMASTKEAIAAAERLRSLMHGDRK